MVGLKRTYHIAGMEAQTIAKRLKRVEAKARRNSPEVKSVTFAATGTLAVSGSAGDVLNIVANNINEGTGANERVGDRIRLLKVEVRGVLDNDIDAYIIKLNTTSEPTRAIFTSAKGSYIVDSESDSRFTEMKHFRNYYVTNTQDAPIRLTQKLGNMVCYYNGTTGTAGIRNQICVTLLNRDTATAAYNLNVRLWYTDA